MKTSVSVAIVISLMVVSGFVGAYVMNRNEAPRASTSQAKTMDSSSVASHNTAQDCWLIVDGKVYDVTKYLGLHPGGAPAIIPSCGSDATTLFGSVRQHRANNPNSEANNELKDLYIGDLSV